MSLWSHPSHKFATSSQEALPENFKYGIELSLGQLIEMRNQSIINWLNPDSKVKSNRVGGFRSHFKGRGMDFDESRIYQIGDDIRNIDWRVTARTGEAHTKLFKEERERPVFIMLDQMPGMFFGTTQAFKSVVASKIAAQLMWSSLANGDRFGAVLFSENSHLEMKPSSNRRNCMRLLNKIVNSHQQVLGETFAQASNKTAQAASIEEPESSKNMPFSAALKRLKYLAKPGSLIHIISDFNQFDDACQQHLSKLSQHTDIHCVLIKDPIEEELPPPGNYGITDGTNRGVLNTRQASLRQDYKQAFDNKIARVKDFALSHRGLFSQVDTNLEQSVYGHASVKGAC